MKGRSKKQSAMDAIRPGMCFSPRSKITATCTVCGGTNVQLAFPVWMRPNNKDEFICVNFEDDPFTYCDDCDSDTPVTASSDGKILATYNAQQDPPN